MAAGGGIDHRDGDAMVNGWRPMAAPHKPPTRWTDESVKFI